MKGLLHKIWLEVRFPVLLFSIGLAVIMGLLGALLPRVLGNMDKLWDTFEFAKPLISALVGMDISEGFFTAEMMQAFLWVHPTVLTLIWAHELMFCSRVPAGEIDRGTVDFLLGLPVSRFKLYLAETIVWLASGMVIVATGLCGLSLAATTFETDMKPDLFELFCVVSNLVAVYVAVGGMAFFVSACSDRRGRAIGVMFAILLASFLVNFVAVFVEQVRVISWLSILEYYRPAEAIQAQAFPLKNVAILLTIGFGCWAAGAAVFRRRSVCTV